MKEKLSFRPDHDVIMSAVLNPQHLNLNFILAWLAEDVSQEHFCVILCLYFLQSENEIFVSFVETKKVAGMEWSGGTNKQEIIKINIMELS